MMLHFRLFWLLGLGLLISHQPLRAQNISSSADHHLIKGVLLDAETLEVLPSAHIILKDTYTGTITNADGEFNLMVEQLPVIITARFVGYQTKDVQVQDTGFVRIELEPAVLNMNELIITEDDPALYIMEQVIQKKQEWRSELFRFRAKAYTRQQLRSDTSIVSITESLSELYWDKEKGTREILKSKRQTANMEQASNFAGVSYTPNFYDDNLDITGFNMVGVTHPDALEYYHFKLMDYTSIDDVIVYEIQVSPKRELQPLFTGTIQVLDESFALLSVRLKPNDVVVFPPPVQEFNVYYEQQYNNFGGDFWLPVDFRLDGEIEIGLPGLKFPPIGFVQISKLSDYAFNEQVLAHYFLLENSVTVDSLSIQSSDSLFVRSLDVVPLSQEEESAYATLDSTASLEKSFQPTGFLAKYVTMNDEENDADSDTSSTRNPLWSKLGNMFTTELRYNRVDALYLGVGLSFDFSPDDRLNVAFTRGYSFGYEQAGYRFETSYQWDPDQSRNRFWASIGSETAERFEQVFYPRLFLSFPVLLGFEDYNDYYRSDYWRVGLKGRFDGRFLGRRMNYNFYYTNEQHGSIDYSTAYDIRGLNQTVRFNPPIMEGQLGALAFEITGGSGKEALGVIEANDLSFRLETAHSSLGSDWNYSKVEIEWFERLETFYQRRLIPNVLDLRLHAGSYFGDLPIQKNGVLDAALGVYSPFGVFKTKTFSPYEGASYASLYAEHNFRSVPLEAMGWRAAAKKGLSLLVFGGVGQTWDAGHQKSFMSELPGHLLPGTQGIHSEIGISLSNLFSLIRLDFAYRIDEPGFYPGISLSRLF